MQGAIAKRQGLIVHGFTLVELLVVIAIIGVLVALLLPAVQAAREAARRTQCSNQMRQMSLALQNHESTRKIFPTGGIDPWPRIEDYAAEGKPFAAPKQGLSWAFQILPYLEQNAVHNLVDSQQLPLTPVGLYYCPSRRGPTQSIANGLEGRWLMDYAALVGAPARSDVGDPSGPLYRSRIRDITAYNEALGNGRLCSLASANLFWGGSIIHMSADITATFSDYTSPIYPTQGVIVRSSYFVADDTGQTSSPVIHDLQLPGPTKFKQITDGASNTAVLCEKRIDSNFYDGVDDNGNVRIDDDAGWSDGWDFDTLRLAYCPPASDSSPPIGDYQMTPGSAHASIFFCVFADGSVHGLNYDINVEILNRLANKSDGEVVGLDL